MAKTCNLPCLSLRQPWASALFLLGKDVENRTWFTTYRGPLLIHASKTIEWGTGVKLDPRTLLRGYIFGSRGPVRLHNRVRSRDGR